MPLTSFKCPDGEFHPVDACLRECRMPERCLTLPTLRFVAEDRKWDGKPHITNLLNGVMLEFLKATKDYSIDPTDMAFALLGSEHHRLLEALASQGMGEIHVGNKLSQGTADLLEVDKYGEYILSDYKTAGAYKVCKQLGVVWREIGRGPRGGIKKEYYIDPSAADTWEWDMQLNAYRLKFEEAGLHISRMQIQCTVRDGNLRTSKDMGIKKTIYMIPIQRLNDAYVRAFFDTKSQMMAMAISSGVWEQPCNKIENWDGRRCVGYCPVNVFCPNLPFALMEHGDKQ